MRKIFTLSIALILGSAIATVSAATASTLYQFAENSSLSKGKWVRITVPETGVYEITYDQLKDMGFSNPSKVSVYGKGGAHMNFNFLGSFNKNDVIFSDNPRQLRVLHANNKLMFYGRGPEEIKASSVDAGEREKMKFDVTSKNIYSDVSYYFLSDANDVISVPVYTVSNHSNAILKEKGFTYFYHEVDLHQSGEGTGQQFWGENITVDEPLTFKFRQPYAIAKEALVNSTIAVDAQDNCNLYIGFNNVSATLPLKSFNNAQFVSKMELKGEVVKFDIDKNNVGTAEVCFSTDAGHRAGKLLALDWFTVSCPIDLALAVDDPDFAQQYICFPSTSNQRWKFRVPDDVVVWEVTDPFAMTRLEVEKEYDKSFAYNMASSRSEMVVFNPAKTQKQIGSDWKNIENQNLHAYQKQGVDLLIFSTEEMLPYAKQIGELHEKNEGIKTLVVTPTQIFNEFSTGTPDAMAYRAMAKMLYQNSANPLKNVLLIGKMSNDLRNVRNAIGHGECHPVHSQVNPEGILAHCFTIMDYFGIVTDFVASTTNLNTVPVSLGVGILPILTHEEGANVVNKIKDYLETEDFSAVVNETFQLTCNGDSYSHDIQGSKYAALLDDLNSNFNSRFSNTHFRFEGLSSDMRSEGFRTIMERGKLFGIYFGHAGPYGLGRALYGPNVDDLMQVKNKDLGLFFMAGCDLFYPDRGYQGMGDTGVTRAARAFNAVVCATGTVMSTDNERLARTFLNSFYFDSNKNLRTATTTIGEAFAQAKNQETSSSSLSYVLVGDPALKLPLPLGSISMEIEGKNFRGGELVTVKGKVTNADNSIKSDYNGYVTLKVMEPSKNIEIPVVNQSTGSNYTTEITDLRLVTVKGKVTNGEFTVSVPLPSDCDSYLSADENNIAQLPIYASTYDPRKQLGCSGVTYASMAIDGSEPDADALRDKEKPTLSLAFNEHTQVLSIEAVDDVALLPGIGTGKAVTLVITGNGHNETITVASPENYGVATPAYSTAISMAHLAPGSYTAKAFAVDLGGNRSDDYELPVTITKAVPLVLSAASEYAIDSMKFNLKGESVGELSLIMTDAEGNTVYTSDFSGKTLDCDLSDLKAGIYRAAVRHDSAMGARLYSNWVEFTVID